MNRKSGFTLLEVLVVIIIVGVLAAVAMPTLFRNIKRAEAAEALTTIGMIYRGLMACGMQYNGAVVQCAPSTPAAFDSIGMTDPSSSVNPASKFDYAIFCGGIASSYSCSIVATHVEDGVSTIQMAFTQNGPGAKIGSSLFQGIQ
jgi:prepilin-type N-terminal cleavage/methylation domain-containing protein